MEEKAIMAGAALTAGAAGLGLTYLRRNQGDAAIDRWDEACFLESEEKEALQAYVNDGRGSKRDFSEQKPSPNLLRSAVAFLQWDKEKHDAEVQRQKLELQRQKLEQDKHDVELQRQKLEQDKHDVELQRQKLELQKDKDKHDVELQRQKLQLQLEEDKRDAELEKKRKAQELEKDLQTTQLAEKAISIKRKSQLSESEANVLLNAAWHPELPLHRILKLGTDLTDWKGQINKCRKRIEFRGTTTTFGRKYRKYRSPWQQQKIEGWPALKTKIIEKHNSAIFDNITVVWVNSSKEYSLKFLTDDKVTPGKDCGEEKEEVEVEVDEGKKIQVEDRVTRNVFRIRWAGKDAFLKVGTSTQVAREIHIRHFLCPMDTIKGKIVKCRGTSRPALLLEDAGSPVAIVDMLPTDVYQMSKEIYNLLLHVQGEHGINHNDIAMRNICKKNGVYTLIDWGVASGCGLPPPTCIPDWDTGATCFLEGERPGPESDLESLFYVCLQLLGFKLPWESINDEEDEAITLRRYLQVPSDLFEYIYEPLRGRFVR